MWGREEGRQAKRSTGPDPIYELRRELSSLRERHETEIGRLRFQDELLNRLENELTSLSSKSEALSAQVAYTLDIVGDIPRERQRLDYVLAEMEGIGKLYTDLRTARQTVEFQSAFDEPSPLVTVVIATTERPKLLVERCLRSIIDQSYQNLQILESVITAATKRLSASPN